MREIAQQRKAAAALLWAAKAYLYHADNCMMLLAGCFAVLALISRSNAAKDFCFWYALAFGWLTFESVGISFYFYDAYTVAPLAALYMVFWERLAAKVLGGE